MRFSWFKIMLATLAIAFTVGCGGGGGGGGGDNPAPTPKLEFITPSSQSVQENTNESILLEVKNAKEPVTYSIAGGDDKNLFRINGNLLSFKDKAPTYIPGEENLYEVQVQAKDADNKTATLDVKVSIKNVSLYFTTKSNLTVDENTTNITQLAVANASGDVKFEIVGGDDSDKFELQNNILAFKTRPDYENPTDTDTDGKNTYIVAVKAYDKVDSATNLFTVKVTDVETGLAFVIEPNVTVKEKTVNVTTLGVVNAAKNVTYEISGKDKDKFVIARPSNELKFKTAPIYDPDATNVYEVTIEANDGIDSVDLAMKISVVPLPIAFTNPADVEVSEGTIEVQKLSVSNAHGKVVYDVVDGADKDKFTTSNDLLVFKKAPDYDEPDDSGNDRTYVVVVEAKDQGGVVATQEMRITVTPLEHPKFTSENKMSVPEYTKDVGTIHLISQYDIKTLELDQSNDYALFDLTPSNDKKSAALAFKEAPKYNENGDNIYHITIVATDINNNSTSFDLEITVTEVKGEDVNVTSVVYDNNLTETKSDDTLTIYFSTEIDASSFPDTIRDAFKIVGKDCIGDSTTWEYVPNWPYKLIIKLNDTAEIPDENTTVAIADKVIKLPNGKLVAESNAKNVETALPVYKTGQTESYDENGKKVIDGSLKDDGYYQKGRTNTLTRDETLNVVIDQGNALMWQDDDESVTKPWIIEENWQKAQDGNLSAYYDQSGDTAKTYCENLTLGGFDDWRLPNIEELNSIIMKGKSPAIDVAFKHVINNFYWTNTPCDECPEFAWAAHPISGVIKARDNKKNMLYNIRCVRDYEKGSE